MSIHTILSQEIVSDKTNRIYVRSKKYPNGGLIMGEEVDTFLKHLATRIVEEVGEELIGEDEPVCTKKQRWYKNPRNRIRNNLRASQRTKIQKMKGDL